jgi:DNA repair protein RadC
MSALTPRAAADRFAEIFAGAKVEKLAVAHLDKGGAIIALREREGSLVGEIDLPIREMLVEALKLGSAGLILAHNHPSGDPSPSRNDIHATRMLAAAGRALEIPLLDHLIFAGDKCASFREMGLL